MGGRGLLVLVTGATGFLGRRVVPELQRRQHDVRCLVHAPGGERVFSPRSVDVCYGSVTDPQAVATALQGVGAVVHLAAIFRRPRGTTYDQINRQGVVNVVAAAKQARVNHFVQVSAIGASNNTAYPYLHSKWQGEQEVVRSGLPYTVLQSSVMFGEGDEFLNVIAAMIRLAPLVPVVGSGRNRLQPVAAEDMAHCVAQAVDRSDLKGRTVEVGGPQQLTYNEVVGAVARTMGRRVLRLHLPVWLLYLAAQGMRVMPRPPVTTDQLRLLPVRNVAEPDAVEKTFGFTPRPLEGNIGYVRSVTTRDAINILTGSMPTHIRDH
jgi:NADH dehydrogenase